MDLICQRSGKAFGISEAEQIYCTERGIPLATLCPQEQWRELLAFRNETALFVRKSDKTGQELISCHRPDSKYKIYEKDILLSDEHDPLAYGQPYDFNRPFFEQFHELSLRVPRPPLFAVNAENSPYANCIINVKNCYYTFSCSYSEDCMYGSRVYHCRDCVENNYITQCELCYECINCHSCYNLKWSTHCLSCRDSCFLYNCRNCFDCFGCVGLSGKSYCIWNVQYSQTEYEEKVRSLLITKRSEVKRLQEKFELFCEQQNTTYNSIDRSEDCTGGYIEKSSNCMNSYFIKDCQGVENGLVNQHCKDHFSIAYVLDSELNYRGQTIGSNSYNCQFCSMGTNIVDSQYCTYTYNCSNMFGCCGFYKRAAHCILNRQYSKEEYDNLVPEIIAHMKSTGEYGQFFPMYISDFPYRDTLAQEFFPLSSSEEAMKLGVNWSKEKAYPTSEKGHSVPDDIGDVDDALCNHIITDPNSSQAFRFQKKEIEFHRAHSLPLPEESFESRNLRRAKKLLSFTS